MRHGTSGRLTRKTAGTAANRKRSAASAKGGTVSSAQRIGHEREPPHRDDGEDQHEVAGGEAVAGGHDTCEAAGFADYLNRSETSDVRHRSRHAARAYNCADRRPCPIIELAHRTQVARAATPTSSRRSAPPDVARRSSGGISSAPLVSLGILLPLGLLSFVVLGAEGQRRHPRRVRGVDRRRAMIAMVGGGRARKRAPHVDGARSSQDSWPCSPPIPPCARRTACRGSRAGMGLCRPIGPAADRLCGRAPRVDRELRSAARARGLHGRHCHSHHPRAVPSPVRGRRACPRPR